MRPSHWLHDSFVPTPPHDCAVIVFSAVSSSSKYRSESAIASTASTTYSTTSLALHGDLQKPTERQRPRIEYQPQPASFIRFRLPQQITPVFLLFLFGALLISIGKIQSHNLNSVFNDLFSSKTSKMEPLTHTFLLSPTIIVFYIFRITTRTKSHLIHPLLSYTILSALPIQHFCFTLCYSIRFSL